MNPPAGTIDLGELPREEPVVLDAPWPIRRRLRGWRRSRWRIAGAAAAAALTLTTIAGAAAPSRPPLLVQYTIHGVSFTLDEENLYVVERADPPGTSTLTAYRLTDGTVRWRSTPLPTPAGSTWATAWGESLIVIGQPQSGDSETPERTIRFDRATGRQLWSHEGSPFGSSTVDETMLLATPVSASPPIDDVGWRPSYRLTAIDAVTGTPRWHRDLPDQWRHQTAEDRLITMSPDGRELVSYDLTTGEPLTSTRLDRREQPDLLVVGSLVMVLSGWETDPLWEAYDVDTLAYRWSLAPGLEEESWPYECGGRICLGGTTPGVIDPATGDRLWSWLPALASPGYYYDLQLHDAPQAGVLVITSAEPDDMHRHHWLLDAETGRLMLDLGDWSFPSFGSPLRSWGGPAIPTATAVRSIDDVLWVGRLRPDLSGVDPVGALTLPRAADLPLHECVAWPARLLCMRQVITNNVGVSGWEFAAWELPG